MWIRMAGLALVCLGVGGCLDLGGMWHADPPAPFYTRAPVEDRGAAVGGPVQWRSGLQFSADGAELLYTSQDAATDGGAPPVLLQAVRLADGGRRTIDTKGARASSFAATADGGALYVVVTDGGFPATWWLYEAVAGEDVPLGLAPIEVIPAPSGRRLLVRPVGDGTPDGQLWRVVDLDGGAVHVTPCAEAVSFSPAGDELACGPLEGTGIVRQRLSDGAVTRLPGLRRGWPSATRWSAEGIVTASFANPDLFFGDPATGAVAARTAVGPHEAVGAWPSFSADGGAVIYRENECLAIFEGSWFCNLSEDRLVMADLATGELTTLASSGAELMAFAFSPDGATAAYVYCTESPSCTLHVRATGR